MRWTICLLASAVMAACSSSEDTRDPAADSTQGAFIAAVTSRLSNEKPQDARDVLDASVVAGSPTALLLVVVSEVDAGLTMVPAAANRGTVQWRDAVGGGLLRRGGVLVGTRGFGFDLHNADVAPLRRALRSGGGRGLRRVNVVIDSTDQIVTRPYLCDVTPSGGQILDFYGTRYETTIFDETCQGEDGDSFTNRYWVQGDGTVRRARERVSAEVGDLEINVLKP